MTETALTDAGPESRGPNWMRVSLLLLVLLFATAIGVVFSAHKSRELFRELEQARYQNNAIQIEWRQLLLERSALSSHVRVESLAREELNMRPIDEFRVLEVTP